MEITRKLASVRRITQVTKHPTADALDLVNVGGWISISSRGEFKAGELCVYFEDVVFLHRTIKSMTAERVSKATVEDVGWPLDLNKPKDREKRRQGDLLPRPLNPAGRSPRP